MLPIKKCLQRNKSKLGRNGHEVIVSYTSAKSKSILKAALFVLVSSSACGWPKKKTTATSKGRFLGNTGRMEEVIHTGNSGEDMIFDKSTSLWSQVLIHAEHCTAARYKKGKCPCFVGFHDH